MTLHLQKFLLAAAFAAVLSTLSHPVLAGQPLTEGESLRIGLARTEVTDLARGHIGEAEADALEAGLWANPALEYSRDNSRNGTGIREETWQLSQPFDLSGRRGLKREAGEQRVAAAEADTRLYRAERISEIRRSFFQLLLHERQLAALDVWVKRLADIERVVGKLRAAGEVSGYDLRRMARERHAVEARRAEIRAELERTREQFAALLGADLAAYEGTFGHLLPDAPAGLETLLGKLDTRPDLAALGARAAAADLEGRAAARGWMPEVTLGVGTKRGDYGFGHESLTSFSAAIPLPVFDRQQSNEHRAVALAMGARAEYRLARSRTEGRLRGLHRQVTQLVTASSRYRREAADQSDNLIRIADFAYRAGESSVLELLDAYKGALEAEITALDLEWKAREACIELDQLTGSYPE
ncbi:MAG: TolC family protein [Gallionella sp.]|nr:TolC family protein [Gallionella sp.]